MADIARGNVLEQGHGPVFRVLLNGTVTKGDPIGNDGTGYVMADSNGPVSCMAFALADGVSGDVIPATKQCVQQTTTDLTTGAPLFLSATAGRIADAVVGAVASVTQCLGWVVRGATTELMYLDATIPHVNIKADVWKPTLISAVELKNIFIADRHYQIVGAREVHTVAGTDGGAVTLTVEKVPSGTAKGSGVNMLSSTFNLKSTADTPVWLGPSATAADTKLVPGDRIDLVSSGTLTSVVDTHVSLVLVPYNL